MREFPRVNRQIPRISPYGSLGSSRGATEADPHISQMMRLIRHAPTHHESARPKWGISIHSAEIKPSKNPKRGNRQLLYASAIYDRPKGGYVEHISTELAHRPHPQEAIVLPYGFLY